MEQNQKIQLFESMPIPKAVAQLSIPMVFSSLVMVLYNMADTYFVGMLNDPVQNAAVALAAPVLLAFNAVNNLFGVGTSSMMSRAMGRKDYNTVEESSAFGFYCALVSGIIFGILCTVFGSPLLTLIGADETTRAATQGYMFWTVSLGAAPAIVNVVMAYLVRSEGASLHPVGSSRLSRSPPTRRTECLTGGSRTDLRFRLLRFYYCQKTCRNRSGTSLFPICALPGSSVQKNSAVLR